MSASIVGPSMGIVGDAGELMVACSTVCPGRRALERFPGDRSTLHMWREGENAHELSNPQKTVHGLCSPAVDVHLLNSEAKTELQQIVGAVLAEGHRLGSRRCAQSRELELRSLTHAFAVETHHGGVTAARLHGDRRCIKRLPGRRGGAIQNRARGVLEVQPTKQRRQ